MVLVSMLMFGCAIETKKGMTLNELYQKSEFSLNPPPQLVGQIQDIWVYKAGPARLPPNYYFFKNDILIAVKTEQQYLADVAQGKAQQQEAQKAQSDKQVKEFKLREQNRIAGLKAKKYSIFPAKFTVETQAGNGYASTIIVSSKDDEPFLLERVVLNNKSDIANCDKSNIYEYMTTGDSKSVSFWGCGDRVVKVDVYTNRGSSTFKLN